MDPPENSDPEDRKILNKMHPAEYRKEFHRINSRAYEYLNLEYLGSILEKLYPGQLVFDTYDGIDGDYYYIYQFGSQIRLDYTGFPNLPFKLFEDNPPSKTKEIYGIVPYAKKL